MGGDHHCGAVAGPPLGTRYADDDAELPEAYDYGRALIWTVIDTVVREVVTCQEPTVEVTLLDDGAVQVCDGGRGIPFSLPDMPEGALATSLEVETHRDGHRCLQQIGLGLSGTLERREPTTRTGTAVRCWASYSRPREAEYMALATRLQHLAVLNKGLTITLVDQQPSPQRTRTFCYPGGLLDYVRFVNRTKFPLHRSIIRFAGRIRHVEIEVAVQWNLGYSESVYTFANNGHSEHGSAPEQGFRDALTAVVQRYIDNRIPLKAAVPELSSVDIHEGLAAVIAVRSDRDVDNGEVGELVDKFCAHQLMRWFAANPDEADAIADKVISAHIEANRSRRSNCEMPSIAC